MACPVNQTNPVNWCIAVARSDCKRLEIIFTKADVDTPKGRTQAILTTELDYCLDGGPPSSQSSTGMSP